MVEIDKDNLVDLLDRFASQFKPQWIKAHLPEDSDDNIDGLDEGIFVDIYTPNHGRETEVEYLGGVSFYNHENGHEYNCDEDEVWYMLIPDKPQP